MSRKTPDSPPRTQRRPPARAFALCRACCCSWRNFRSTATTCRFVSTSAPHQQHAIIGSGLARRGRGPTPFFSFSGSPPTFFPFFARGRSASATSCNFLSYLRGTACLWVSVCGRPILIFFAVRFCAGQGWTVFSNRCVTALTRPSGGRIARQKRIFDFKLFGDDLGIFGCFGSIGATIVLSGRFVSSACCS